MVGYAAKRRLGEKPKEGIRNRRRSAEWYEKTAAAGLVEGERGARIIARPLGDRAMLDYEFPDPDTMRQRFPELWRRLEERLRASGVQSYVVCGLEDPGNRRWIEPVLIGQLFEPPDRDFVVLERHSPLPDEAEPQIPAGYVLRPASMEDEDALLPIWAEAQNPEHANREGLRDTLRSSWTVVADHDGAPAGLCSMNEDDGVAWVDAIAVAPQHRGKGVGEALLLAGLAWARDNQPGPVRLYTDFWRTEAMGLYKKHGFVQAYTGVQFRRPMDPAVIEEILSKRKATYSRWVGFR